MKLKTSIIFKTFLYWLPFAGIATILSGLIYVAVQQDYRINANDPQIQIAEDASAQLSQGAPTQSLVPQSPVDIATSLDPYITIFDEKGNIVATSASLNGTKPSIPSGVFDYVSKHGEERFTWQPKPGVRQAVVVRHYSGTNPGFVLVGRSLREVEIRIDNLTAMTGAAYLASLLASLFLVWLSVIVFSEKIQKE